MGEMVKVVETEMVKIVVSRVIEDGGDGRMWRWYIW